LLDVNLATVQNRVEAEKPGSGAASGTAFHQYVPD
jgi:hypothetical protein